MRVLNRPILMKAVRYVFIFVALSLASLPASAEEVTLNFSDADLVAVINSVSQITGKNFIIDPRVKGKVTVVSSKPLNESEVYSVFLSILQVHGFATVPTDNAIKIIPDATAKQSSAPFNAASRNPGDQLITRVLSIEHINAAQLVEGLETQEEEIEQGLRRVIGAILVEKGYMDLMQIQEVLEAL